IIASCNDDTLKKTEQFIKKGNSLEIYKSSFTIIDYNSAGVLKLRLDETTYGFDYLGGILTLTKNL
ncbi:MAG: hypothetical protein PF487_10585, partial [Bacteroidales bacterium]|nr:hypothetical protein [Bacteroidales bacterium]